MWRAWSVPQSLAGEVQEHCLQIGLGHGDRLRRHARRRDGGEDPRQRGAGVLDKQVDRVGPDGDLADAGQRAQIPRRAPASFAKSSSGDVYQTTSNTQLAPEALAPQGGDQPHNNMQPYLTFYFNIALQGVFPPRG